MKRKFKLLFISGVMIVFLSHAQSLTPFVISSSGGYYSSAAGSLSATVAEMTMVQTLSSMGNFLTQGFQQPGEWYVSIPEEPVQGNLSVYPNPSYGNFYVTVQSKEKGEAQLSIYDVLGQKIYSSHMRIVSGANTEYVDIRGYSMGIYLLEYLYTGENGKKESKVVKINVIN